MNAVLSGLEKLKSTSIPVKSQETKENAFGMIVKGNLNPKGHIKEKVHEKLALVTDKKSIYLCRRRQ